MTILERHGVIDYVEDDIDPANNRQVVSLFLRTGWRSVKMQYDRSGAKGRIKGIRIWLRRHPEVPVFAYMLGGEIWLERTDLP